MVRRKQGLALIHVFRGRRQLIRNARPATDNLRSNEEQAMSVTPTGAKPYYYVPQPSYWPITGSCALLLMAVGAAAWFNAYALGPWLLLAGFAVLLTMMFGWFATGIREPETRLYSTKHDFPVRVV